MANEWERFYSAYPKKEGRGAALKAWNTATKGMTPEELEAFTQKAVTAINAQKLVRWDSTERKYIPMASTWINQARWDDEIPSQSQAKIDVAKHDEMCQCGHKAFNRSFCAKCYTMLTNPWLVDEMKENLHKMGFHRNHGETWRDAGMRCLTENGLSNLLPKSIR